MIFCFHLDITESKLELREKFQKFDQAFIKLVEKAQDFAENNDMPITKFRNRFVNTSSHLRTFFSEIGKQCLNGSSESSLYTQWSSLASFWNCWCYEPLQQTISVLIKYAKPDTPLKGEMDLYAQCITKLCKEFQIKELINNWPVISEHLTFEQTEFVSEVQTKLESDWENKTLYDLKKFYHEWLLRKIFTNFKVRGISKGCVSVLWCAEPSATKKLLSREARMNLLTPEFCSEWKVLSIAIDKVVVYSNKQSEEVSLYSIDLRAHYDSIPQKSSEHIRGPLKTVLAKIENEKVLYYFQPDEFTRSTIRGDSTDIWQHKKSCDENALKEEIISGNSKLILVEGVPGSGKTVLSRKFSQMWVSGELYSDSNPNTFVLLHMRDHGVRNITSLTQLFAFTKPKDDPNSIAETVEHNKGRGFIFWLDGWDEICHSFKEDSDKDEFFLKLISRDILPRATVIVTSRPHGAEDIKRRRQDFSHYEIVTSIKNNILDIFNLDSKAACKHLEGIDKEIYQSIENDPAIKSAMHTPLTTTIILDVLRWCLEKGHILPKNLTELYTAYLYFLMSKSAFKEDKEDPLIEENPYELSHKEEKAGISAKQQEQPAHIESWNIDLAFNTLFRNDNRGVEIIQAVAKLLEESKLVYPQIPDSVLKSTDSGIIISKKPLYGGDEKSYHFVHYTLQEFLMAYFIYHQHYSLDKETLSKQPITVQDILTKDRYTVVARFFAGMSHFHNFETDMVPFKNFKTTFHLLFEAGEERIKKTLTYSEIEKFETITREGTVYVSSDYKWNSFDYYVAGFCIAHSSCSWTIDARRCLPNSEEMEFFSKGLSAYQHEVSFIKELILEQNNHSSQFMNNFPPHLLPTLEHLDLSRSLINANQLSKVLPKMINLTYLCLWRTHSVDENGEDLNRLRICFRASKVSVRL